MIVSLVGAVTLTAGILLVRQRQRDPDDEVKRHVPVGERRTEKISLDRLRELGL